MESILLQREAKLVLIAIVIPPQYGMQTVRQLIVEKQQLVVAD